MKNLLCSYHLNFNFLQYNLTILNSIFKLSTLIVILLLNCTNDNREDVLAVIGNRTITIEVKNIIKSYTKLFLNV